MIKIKMLFTLVLLSISSASSSSILPYPPYPPSQAYACTARSNTGRFYTSARWDNQNDAQKDALQRCYMAGEQGCILQQCYAVSRR